MDLFENSYRRVTFLAVAIALLSISAIGQNDDQAVHLGLKAGISIPNLVGGGDEEITRDYKSRFATNFGGFVDIGIRKGFSVQAEVDYASQGGRRNGVQPITSDLPGLPPNPIGPYYYANFKNTAKLDYIEVPVMAKYTWNRKGKVGFYVNGGPYLGFLLKATQVTSGSSTIYLDKNGTPLIIPPGNMPLPPMSFDAKTDVTDELHRVNFGVTGGGGIKFAHKKNYFFVDGRASYGLTTLQKDTTNNGSSKTGALVISVGYAFQIWSR